MAPKGMALSTALPLRLRIILLVGAVLLVAGGSLLTYRYLTRAVSLTVAVGSVDGEAVNAMSAIASRLAATNAPVRLKVIDTASAFDAAAMFSAGKADLAVVRGDASDLSQAQAVVVVAHVVALFVAPPGSSINSMEKLKGRTVGVIGGAANSKIVEVLTKEYDLVRARVVFKNIALDEARQAIQSKEVSSLLVVIPLTKKYLTMVRDLFQTGPKMMPVLIPIESAGAIAQVERSFESFDVPKGTLRGTPPVPDDDLTTLRASLYLVANKKLGVELVTSLTQAVMNARRDLLSEQPILAQIAAPSVDPDAFIPVHPGAAAFYNGTQQTFLDKYGNEIYLMPMLLGAAATLLAATWKFLGIKKPITDGPLDSLYALTRQTRNADSDDELSKIEGDIDRIMDEHKATSPQEIDVATLNVIVHRLESLINNRRTHIAMRRTQRSGT